MKRLIAVAATMFLLGGAAVAAASVVWPSTATTFPGVNAHLNALHTTDLSQLSQARVVQATLTPSGGNSLEGSVQCPGWSPTKVGWYATGGGFVSPTNGDYYASESRPSTEMGTSLPNGWKVSVSDPTYTIGDPLPTDITVYAICAT